MGRSREIVVPSAPERTHASNRPAGRRPGQTGPAWMPRCYLDKRVNLCKTHNGTATRARARTRRETAPTTTTAAATAAAGNRRSARGDLLMAWGVGTFRVALHVAGATRMRIGHAY